VDRLDAWIGTLRGWPLFAARCVVIFPVGFCAGFLWTVWVTPASGAPQAGAWVVRVAVCALAVILTPGRRRDDVGRRRFQPGLPLPTWRATAANYAFAVVLVMFLYEDTEPVAWKAQHYEVLFPAEMLFILLSVGLRLWNARYANRLRRSPPPSNPGES
jgi:hypothetical protein